MKIRNKPSLWGLLTKYIISLYLFLSPLFMATRRLSSKGIAHYTEQLIWRDNLIKTEKIEMKEVISDLCSFDVDLCTHLKTHLFHTTTTASATLWNIPSLLCGSCNASKWIFEKDTVYAREVKNAHLPNKKSILWKTRNITFTGAGMAAHFLSMRFSIIFILMQP